MFESVLLWAQFDNGFPLTAANLPQGLLGQLADRDFGLLPVAPFWVVALAVLAKPMGLPRGYVVFAAAAFVSTWIIASFNPMWWGGYSPSARFLVPTLPVVVPALAEGYRRILAAGFTTLCPPFIRGCLPAWASCSSPFFGRFWRGPGWAARATSLMKGEDEFPQTTVPATVANRSSTWRALTAWVPGSVISLGRHDHAGNGSELP